VQSRIPFHVAHTPRNALRYVTEAIDANQNVNGSFTERCELLLEQRLRVPHVLLTHSATAALEMTALVLASTRGAGRVLMPSYTFSSTANAYVRAGYDLEFVDIDPETMSAGLTEFQAAGPSPGCVIVPVHYAGNPGEIDAIAEWAAESGLVVAEDAAQALGSSLAGVAAGAFGPLAAMSFHFTKNVHSSLGGALYVNDSEMLDTATYVWERGTNRQAKLKGLVDKYSWVEIGSSFQTTETQAALLLSGLEEYDEILVQRGVIWDAYHARLAGRDDDGLHVQRWRDDAVNNHHAFYVRLETAEQADGLRVTLDEAGIQAFIGYVPLHDSPYGRRAGLDRSLPATERWANCVLRLPLHTAMSPGDADRVCDLIDAWLAHR
jgi:dTDP-4-amino-4,6-dideoxygalactose transaminase